MITFDEYNDLSNPLLIIYNFMKVKLKLFLLIKIFILNKYYIILNFLFGKRTYIVEKAKLK